MRCRHFSPVSNRDDTSVTLRCFFALVGVCRSKGPYFNAQQRHLLCSTSGVGRGGLRGRIPGAGDEEEIRPDERGSVLRTPCDVPTCVYVAADSLDLLRCRGKTTQGPAVPLRCLGGRRSGVPPPPPPPSGVKQVVSLLAARRQVTCLRQNESRRYSSRCELDTGVIRLLPLRFWKGVALCVVASLGAGFCEEVFSAAGRYKRCRKYFYTDTFDPCEIIVLVEV